MSAPPWPIVGHTWAVQQLYQALLNEELPHALLITGPESVGKSTLAEILVAALLCRAPLPERPCNVCLSCRKLKSGNHPDFMLAAPEEAGKHVRIEQVRAVEHFLSLTPNESRRKVALITDFERATIGAANALLKTLEEPPAYANLLLLATEADLLLPTIVSRSQLLPLRPVGRPALASALTTRWQLPPARAEQLARLSGGRVGWAVRAATDPAYQERMETAVAQLLTALQQDLPDRFAVAQELAKEELLEEVLEYWLICWRDVLLLQLGNEEALVYREQEEPLRHLARYVELDTTTRVLGMLESAQQALQSNANKQLVMEYILLTLPELT